jgi:hypothetical protein
VRGNSGRRRGRGFSKTAVGGEGAGAREQRSAAGTRERGNSGRRRGRGFSKTAFGGGGADARKQRSAARAQARKISGRRQGRGCAKTAVGGERRDDLNRPLSIVSKHHTSMVFRYHKKSWFIQKCRSSFMCPKMQSMN